MHRRKFLKSLASLPLAYAVTNPLHAFAQEARFPATGGYRSLFPDLPAAQFAEADLLRLANGDGPDLPGMSAAAEMLTDANDQPLRNEKGEVILSATPETQADDEENYGLPAGYTYLGQFADHDITFKADDAFAVKGQDGVNHRSARFDLDSLYGAGPGLQPFLYNADGRTLVRGRALTQGGRPSASFDHPRVDGVAVIGDKRNDENVLVSQMHGAFASFHNALAQDRPRASFEELRQTVTWHYQWMLLTDFLPRLCGDRVMHSLLPALADGRGPNCGRSHRTITADLRPGEMPLEFSDAAYRFGHSAIRSVYRLNTQMTGTAEEQRRNPAAAGRKFIFAAVDQAGLNGNRAFPDEWAIDWGLFFETRGAMTPDQIAMGAQKVQPSYKIDTSLVNPLAFLPEFSQSGTPKATTAEGFAKPKAGAIANLALRNLMRGQASGLASGQDVARAMGIEPLLDEDLMVGKATVAGLTTNRSITAYGDSFRGQAPLWFYVLAEAQYTWCNRARAHARDDLAKNTLPGHLGPVGARLVAETFVALMELDPDSVLHAPRHWQPTYGQGPRFGMVDLIRTAGLG
ncbi:MAG: hypothetical protein RIR04_1361 [Pseudomonadota bacterium]